MRASDLCLARVGLAAAALALALSACQALVTLAVEEPIADGGIDAAPDANGGDGAAVFDACGAVPPPPTTIADAGANVPPLLFAAYELTLDSTGVPDLCAQPGFDLDGLDTGPPGVCTVNASCAQRQESTARILNCDDTGGVDNNVLLSIRYLNQLPIGTLAFDQLDSKIPLSRGVTNMLIEVTDYNGASDDDQVGVGFFSSAGMRGVPNAAGFGFEQIRAMPEVWDGGQDAEWYVTPSSVNTFGGQPTPRYFAPGYVRGNILVVPKVPLGFGPPSISTVDDTALSDGVMTAEIVRNGDTYALRRGRIGTSMKSSALLGTLGRIRSHVDVYMCNSPQYDALRAIACTALDLPGPGVAADAGTPCGAMSIAFAFASVTSRFALNDAGTYELARSYGADDTQPCPDDAGTLWCDDCDWSGPRRCDAGARDGSAGPDAADAGDAADQ